MLIFECSHLTRDAERSERTQWVNEVIYTNPFHSKPLPNYPCLIVCNDYVNNFIIVCLHNELLLNWYQCSSRGEFSHTRFRFKRTIYHFRLTRDAEQHGASATGCDIITDYFRTNYFWLGFIILIIFTVRYRELVNCNNKQK